MQDKKGKTAGRGKISSSEVQRKKHSDMKRYKAEGEDGELEVGRSALSRTSLPKVGWRLALPPLPGRPGSKGSADI